MIINQTGGGGGLDINGVVSEVSAGEAISAGDFVRYFESGMGDEFDITSDSYEFCVLDTCALDSNTFFVTFSTTASKIFCAVFKVSADGTITKGSNLSISTTTKSGNIVRVAKVSENSVLICYSISTGVVYGVVCTISGTTVTKGSAQIVAATSTSAQSGHDVVQLAEGKVFLTYIDMDSSYTFYAYGKVCTISGTTITLGTAKLLFQAGTSEIKSVALSSSKVVIGANNSSTLFLHVCTISGTTVNAGNTTNSISRGSSTGGFDVLALTSSKIFVAYSYSSAAKVYARVFTVSGTTLTSGSSLTVDSTSYSGMQLSAAKISDTEVNLYHCSGSDYYLTQFPCTISGTTITAGTKNVVSSNTHATEISADSMDGTVLVVYGSDTEDYSYPFRALAIGTGGYAVATEAGTIYGVAKTGGTAGDTIQVITP